MYFCKRKSDTMNKISFENFEEYFWNYIGKDLIRDQDIAIDNSDFCNRVSYDCWRIYEQGDFRIDEICKVAENFMDAFKKFRPF